MSYVITLYLFLLIAGCLWMLAVAVSWALLDMGHL